MTIGPRDKPYPIILHVDSNTGNPSKLAESNAIFVSSVSAVTLSATTVCATNWVGIPGGPGTTDHGALTGLSDNDHPQYVLSSTNNNLSSLVSDLQTSAGQLSSTISNHLASAVHWDANTLDARFINASGDSVTGAFTFGSVSAANISATNAYIASTILFNTQVAPNLVVGQIGWNAEDQTIDIQTTVDTKLQVGQESVMLVENKSGVTISNGKVAYVSGTTGGSGKLNVALASASAINGQTAFIIGVATQDIPNESFGFVTTFGKVNGIPLPDFNDGDVAYLGDTPGELRPFRSGKPSHGSFQMGRVIAAHPTNGILFVSIRGSFDVAELHDVASSIPSTGQVLVWNDASGLYEPKNVSAISGINNYATTASLNNYVLTSVNTNLSSLVNNLETSTASISSTVSNHLASAVHWDANTLDTRFINASGDSVTGSFTFGNVTGTTVCATTYLNLPSALATWNANALQGRSVNNVAPGIGELLAWDNSNSRWTPSAVPTGGITNNPGGINGNIQFKNGTAFSGVNDLNYDSTFNSLYARGLSSLSVTATNISATTYSNLPSVTALNGTGVFEVTSYSRSNYVLTSTNLALSNAVTGHLASAVHWDASTLDARFINASGDSVTGSFFFSSLSATNFSATTYLNLPNVTSLNGTGIFEVTSYSRNNYVVTATNLALSNAVTGHLASAVHWDLATLNSTYINASGDSVTGSFTFGSVTATNFSATTYFNLPSVTSLAGTGVFSLTSHNHSVTGLNDVFVTATPANGQSLVWSSTKWIASSIAGGVGGGSFNATAIQGVPVCATAPTNTNQAFVYDSTQSKWKPGYTVYQSTAIPNNANGANGDIYFQYDQSSTLSGLSDTQITTTPTTGQVLAWNSSKWIASSITAGGAAAVGSNYRFQFYKDGSLSSVNFGHDPNTYAGGSISSTLPISTNAWMYVGQNLGVETGIVLYGPNAGGDAYLQNAGAGVSAVSANALLTPSLSATTISATTYRNLPTSSLSGLADVFITGTPVTSDILKWNGSKWVPAADAGGAAVGSNYQFQFYKDGSLSSAAIGYDPNTYGGSVSSNLPLSLNAWAYIDQNLGLGSNITFYGAGGANGYLKVGPASSVSANALITPSLSATIISATNYSGVSLSGSLRDVQITATPTTNHVLKWNGSKWTPAPDISSGGGAAVGAVAGAIQFTDGFTNFDAADAFYYSAKILHNNEGGGGGEIVTDTVTAADVAATNSISSDGSIAATLSLSIGSVSITPSGTSTIRVASSILIPSAIFFGSAIPTTSTQKAGIYYTGQSAQNAPPAIYQCNQDNLNVYANFAQNKSFRIVDQITPAGGFTGSGYEFDGNSFIIQHGSNASASLVVPSNNVLQIQNIVSTITVSANIFQNVVSTITATSVILPSNCLDKLFVACTSNTTITLPDPMTCVGRQIEFIKSDTSGWPINISSVYLKTPTSGVMVNIPRDVVNVISDGNHWYVENVRNVYGNGRSIYFDEFVLGNNETGEVGDLNWAFLNGSVNWMSPTSTLYGGQYVGLIRRASTTTANQIAYMTLNQAGTEFVADTNDYLEIRTRTAVSGAATQFKYRIGLHGGTTITSAVPANGIYFESSAAAISPSNWIAVTIKDSTGTFTDTGFSDVTGLHSLRFFRREGDGAIEFYINNNLVTTHTTNVPADFTPMNPIANITPTSAAQRSFVLDYFGYCLINKYTNRYL